MTIIIMVFANLTFEVILLQVDSLCRDAVTILKLRTERTYIGSKLEEFWNVEYDCTTEGEKDVAEEDSQGALINKSDLIGVRRAYGIEALNCDSDGYEDAGRGSNMAQAVHVHGDRV